MPHAAINNVDLYYEIHGKGKYQVQERGLNPVPHKMLFSLSIIPSTIEYKGHYGEYERFCTTTE